jgi:hypothetical protein
MDIKTKEIKRIIRKQVSKNKISYKELSEKTNINLYKLMCLLFLPVLKIKLTHGIAISKALRINPSKFFDIQIDIHNKKQI